MFKLNVYLVREVPVHRMLSKRPNANDFHCRRMVTHLIHDEMNHSVKKKRLWQRSLTPTHNSCFVTNTNEITSSVISC